MRRLGAKTQVLTAGTDDFSRTRLTHSLEVAQIGREIGRALGADPDVVDTACLAHDLGHPPFGHNGETALAEAAKDIGGFEGNAQTLRLLTRLEPKVIGPDGTPEGLNLTRASLDACTKYPWRFDDRPWTPAGKRSGKFGVYDDDLPVFTWLRDGAPPGRRSFEAQVMDLADDIAYSVHDVEDAVVSGRVDLAVLDSAEERARVVEATRDWYGPWNEAADLDAAFERLRAAGYLRGGYDGTRRGLAHLKDTTSQIIGRLSGAAERATIEAFGPGPHARYRSQLVVPDETSHEMLLLKGIAVTYVMAPRGREPVYGAQREILHDLVSALLDRGASALEASFSSDFQAAGDDAARLRVVIDQVASLTDLSAVVWHHRLLGTDRWTGEEIAASGFPWLGS
jgi:dGTPase